MKISVINNLNFKRNKSIGLSDISFNSSENNPENRPVSQNPDSLPCSLGRDLVKNVKTVKKPLPFSQSDEKLVLDKYQQEAIDLFREGKNVIVTAPTGTGKTLIAEHAINDILKSGKKVIYTTPLKALCNDKYKQFCALWGNYDENGNLLDSPNVGLATGDIKINTNAPIVIMTTEIYKNMLVQSNQHDIEKELKDVEAVIYDEFHYMGDSQRGSVWEEALMFSPPQIKNMMLSATIANAEPITDWLNSINESYSSVVVNVPEEERHVPQKYLSYSNVGSGMGLYDLLSEKINLKKLKTKNLSSREKEVLEDIGKIFKEQDGITAIEKKFSNIFDNSESTANLKRFIEKLTKFGVLPIKAEQYGLILSDKTSRKINPELFKIRPLSHSPLIGLVKELEKNKMTPALYFVYSRKKCKDYMKDVSEKVGPLLNKEEQNEVKRRIDKIRSKGIFLGTDFEKEVMPCLLKGFVMHHSGMLPQCKSFIEELGRSKLIKVCFATDTLGAGINFPFKTVVFSEFKKSTGTDFEEISVNTFKQGAGRGGRRNIDDIGYVVVIPKDREEAFVPYQKIIQESDDVKSAFKPTYSLILSPRFLNNSLNILSKSFDNFQRKTYEDSLKRCNSMKNILIQREFVEEEEGILKLTQKGRVASRINGINEILMTEILYDPSITKGITESELSGLISMFSPENEIKNESDKDTENSPENDMEKVRKSMPYIKNSDYKQMLLNAADMAIEIKHNEIQQGITSDIKINPQIIPYIKIWAEASGNKDTIGLWSRLVKEMISADIIRNEGDFFKKITYTTNILKQLQKMAPQRNIRKTAEQAIKMLQKSPVDDILLYELDHKKVHE